MECMGTPLQYLFSDMWKSDIQTHHLALCYLWDVTTKFLLYTAFAKLTKDEITDHTSSENCARKLPFFLELLAFWLLIINSFFTFLLITNLSRLLFVLYSFSVSLCRMTTGHHCYLKGFLTISFKLRHCIILNF